MTAETSKGLDTTIRDTQRHCKAAAQFLAAGSVDEAEAAYQAALKSEPKNLQAMVGLGNVAWAAKVLPLAEKRFKAAATTHPASPRPLIRLVQLFHAQKRWSDAEKAATAALAVNIDNLEAALAIGRMRLDKSDFTGASAAFELADRIAPNDPVVVFDLARCLLKCDRLADAEARYLHCIEIGKPEQRLAIFAALAVLARKRGDPATARAHLEQALALAPQDKALQAELARAKVALARLGKDPATAQSELTAALELLPNDIHLLLEQADVHHKAGRLDDAETYYRRLLRETPDLEPALLGIAAIDHDRARLVPAAPTPPTVPPEPPAPLPTLAPPTVVAPPADVPQPASPIAGAPQPSSPAPPAPPVSKPVKAARLRIVPAAPAAAPPDAQPMAQPASEGIEIAVPAAAPSTPASPSPTAAPPPSAAQIIPPPAAPPKPPAPAPALPPAVPRDEPSSAASEQTAERLRELERACAAPSATPDLFLRATAHLRDDGSFEDARRLLQQGMARFPTHVGLWARHAAIALAAGDLGAVEAAIATQPVATPAAKVERLILQSRLAQARWALDDARQMLAEALALDPSNVAAALDLTHLDLLRFDVAPAKPHQRSRPLPTLWPQEARPPAHGRQLILDQIAADLARAPQLSGTLAALGRQNPWQRIVGYIETCRRNPDSYASAIALLVELRQSGYLEQPAGDGDSVASPPLPIPRVLCWFEPTAAKTSTGLKRWNGWIAAHPHYRHDMFDAAAATGFLRAHAAPTIVDAFQATTDPQRQCELFRLVYLYTTGGIAIDRDMRCRSPVDPLLAPAKTFVACQSEYGTLDDGLIAVAAGHPVIKRAIDRLLTALRQGEPADDFTKAGGALLTSAMAGWIAESANGPDELVPQIEIVNQTEARGFWTRVSPPSSA